MNRRATAPFDLAQQAGVRASVVVGVVGVVGVVVNAPVRIEN